MTKVEPAGVNLTQSNAGPWPCHGPHMKAWAWCWLLVGVSVSILDEGCVTRLTFTSITVMTVLQVKVVRARRLKATREQIQLAYATCRTKPVGRRRAPALRV
jgi:hypothetical protein